MVAKVGPAFSLAEVTEAHQALDRAGAPRRIDDVTLTLPERIAWLHEAAMLVAAECEVR
jgi:hypothetical protein